MAKETEKEGAAGRECGVLEPGEDSSPERKGASAVSDAAGVTDGTFRFRKRQWKALRRVQLFAAPWTIQSMEFFRPEYRSR